jgi:hypothetical protein
MVELFREIFRKRIFPAALPCQEDGEQTQTKDLLAEGPSFEVLHRRVKFPETLGRKPNSVDVFILVGD